MHFCKNFFSIASLFLFVFPCTILPVSNFNFRTIALSIEKEKLSELCPTIPTALGKTYLYVLFCRSLYNPYKLLDIFINDHFTPTCLAIDMKCVKVCLAKIYMHYKLDQFFTNRIFFYYLFKSMNCKTKLWNNLYIF